MARNGEVFWGNSNEVAKGKLKQLKDFLDSVDGEQITLVFEKYFEKRYRSLQQNNYYWGVVVATFQDYTGYTKEETHEVLGKAFLTYEKVSPKTGRKAVFVKSTTDLDTKEFEEYMQKCRELGMKYGLNIPEPNAEDNEVPEF